MRPFEGETKIMQTAPLSLALRPAVSAVALVVALAGLAASPVPSLAAAPLPPARAQAVALITPTPATPTNGFADLVEAVRPAVVSVYVQGTEPDAESNYFQNLPPNSPLRRFFQQFGEQFGQQQPPQRFEAAGSGFAISADGYFVTNNHVVENANDVTVVFDDGTQKPARIVGTDDRTDLAVLKVDGLTDQPFVKFAETSPRVGDWVIAMGNPFGLGGTVTQGVVSAKGRDIGGSGYGDFLQIDAAVNRGNSGGPTFNMQGEVVGVNAEIYSPNGGSVGIAFDIPANVVQNVTSQLIKTGTVTRAFLGVQIQDITPDIANSLGMQAAHGALVAAVNSGTPADKAGIKSGDVVTAVNGAEIKDALDLSRTISDMAPGTSVQITLLRDGREQTVTAELQKMPAQSEQQQQGSNNQPAPAQPTPGPVAEALGLTVVPNSGGPGVLIQDVAPNSPADDKGLAVGDTILEVNNQQIASADQFENAIKSVEASGRQTALVKIERNGQVRFVGLPVKGGSTAPGSK
jgi:serine protease Do